MLEGSLVYTVTSRPVRAIQQDPFSNNAAFSFFNVSILPSPAPSSPLQSWDGCTGKTLSSRILTRLLGWGQPDGVGMGRRGRASGITGQ